MERFKRLQPFFNAEGAGGAGGATGAGDQGAGTGEGGNNGSGATGGNEPKTFTQEQVDAIIADRLKRATSKYSDYEEKAKKAAEFDEWKQSQMSEQEKLQAALKAEQEARAKAEQELSGLQLTMAKKSALSKEGLPEEFAERLRGTTAEEIEEDAKLLKTILGKVGGGVPIGGGGNPAGGTGKAVDFRNMSQEEFQKAMSSQFPGLRF